MLLTTGSAWLGALEDGVYPTRADAALGARLSPCTARGLYAQDNANSHYLLSLAIPTTPGVDGFHHVVVLQGRALPVIAIGSLEHGEEITVRLDASACDAAQRLFAVVACPRSHPGYLIDGSFTPEHPTSHVGEAVHLHFQLRNVGTRPFAFTVGGRQRGPRDNQFTFAGTRDTCALAPVVAFDHGGLMHTEVVAAGGTYEATVDLGSWFPDLQPGWYDLHGSFSFEVADPTTSQVRWEDTLTRDFTLQVVPMAAATPTERSR